MDYVREEVIDEEYPVYVPWTPSKLPDGSDPNGYEPGKEEWCEGCKKCQCVECQLKCTSPKLSKFWMILYRWVPFVNCGRIACCAVAKLNHDRLKQQQAQDLPVVELTKRRVTAMESSRLLWAFKYLICNLCLVSMANENLPNCSRPVSYCSAKCFGNTFVEKCHCVNWEKLKMSRRYVAKDAGRKKFNSNYSDEQIEKDTCNWLRQAIDRFNKKKNNKNKSCFSLILNKISNIKGYK
ncbi:Hypothetical protein CINCED_3A001867 [Cinara cedri]|uniref:Uncharacterized protein n=1 Tax=Cinara cedri TaxID=506608 RepID=A0A5E4NBD0_9HEMI|nr:Hypothetical protein CINCED_3A001867 [Cinara cedri]